MVEEYVFSHISFLIIEDTYCLSIVYSLLECVKNSMGHQRLINCKVVMKCSMLIWNQFQQIFDQFFGPLSSLSGISPPFFVVCQAFYFSPLRMYISRVYMCLSSPSPLGKAVITCSQPNQFFAGSLSSWRSGAQRPCFISISFLVRIFRYLFRI